MTNKTTPSIATNGGSTLDTAALNLIVTYILPALRPALEVMFRFRNQMSQPLNLPVIPKWVPLIPGLRSLCFITYGQVLLAVPLVVLILAGTFKSFLDPNLDLSGHIAAVALLMAFLTANKSSSVVSFALGIPFERLIPFHNLASLVAIVLSCFHTYVAYVHDDEDEDDGSSDGPGSRDRRLSEDSAYALTGPTPDFLKFLLDGWTNISGTIIIILMTGLVATSFFSILRRWFFEFWLFTHVLCSVGVIVFCLVHGVITILIVAIWWAADLAFRYIIMAQYLYPKKATLELVLDDVVEVRFPKTPGFDYNAGQFVQVSFPAIAPLQFHPITISSAPHEQFVTLHIRALGSWSRKIVSLAGAEKETSIMLEGPYGSLAMDLDNDMKYQIILTVAGGIGVTPCQSVAQSILYKYQSEERKLQKLQFVWAVQNLDFALAINPPPIIECTTVVGDNEGSTTVEANSEGNSDVYVSQVYVTKPGSSDVEKDEAGCDTPFDVFEGRPNLDAILHELKGEAEQHKLTRIAVVGCGPKAMMGELQAACRNNSDSALKSGGVTFDLHEEIFDF